MRTAHKLLTILLSPIVYLLRDEFTTPQAAGAVNGTPAEPGIATRNAIDTESKLSITGNAASFAGGKAIPVWGDPHLDETPAIVRAVGTIIIQAFTPSAINQLLAVGLKDLNGGNWWGVSTDASGNLIVLDNAGVGGANVAVAVYGIGAYQVAVVPRANGAWYFIKGGSFVTWTMLYPGTSGSTTPLALCAESNNAVFSTTSWKVPQGRTYIPQVLASDSFNRANGALSGSLTDGDGTPEGAGVTGGSGLSWTNQAGTWVITTNKANPSTLSGGLAVATLNTDSPDGVYEMTPSTTGAAVGFVLNWVDSSNYIRVTITTAVIDIRKFVGGVQTVILNTAITYSAGARLIATVDGTIYRIYYNGVNFGGDKTIADAVLRASTIHGLFANGTGSAINTDSIAIWPRANHNALAAYNSSISQPVHAVRQNANNWLIQLPISGVASNIKVEYQIRKITAVLAGWGFASNCWHLGGIKVIDLTGAVPDIVLMDISGVANTVLSAFEYAYNIGIAGDIQANFDFYGSLHQAQKSTGMTVSIDGLDVTALASGASAFGSTLVIAQTMDTYLPKDKTTVIGSSALTHTFTQANQLQIDHSHAFIAGYEMYSSYSAMLPLSPGDIDTMQTDNNAAHFPRTWDDGAYNLDTQTDTVLAWHSSAHNYRVRMTLPFSAPSSAADWSKSGSYKAWIQDRSPNPTGILKAYVNLLDGIFANRYNVSVLSAAEKISRTRYSVELKI